MKKALSVILPVVKKSPYWLAEFQQRNNTSAKYNYSHIVAPLWLSWYRLMSRTILPILIIPTTNQVAKMASEMTTATSNILSI
jgi:hypothetical protein